MPLPRNELRSFQFATKRCVYSSSIISIVCLFFLSSSFKDDKGQYPVELSFKQSPSRPECSLFFFFKHRPLSMSVLVNPKAPLSLLTHLYTNIGSFLGFYFLKSSFCFPSFFFFYLKYIFVSASQSLLLFSENFMR